MHPELPVRPRSVRATLFINIVKAIQHWMVCTCVTPRMLCQHACQVGLDKIQRACGYMCMYIDRYDCVYIYNHVGGSSQQRGAGGCRRREGATPSWQVGLKNVNTWFCTAAIAVFMHPQPTTNTTGPELNNQYRHDRRQANSASVRAYNQCECRHLQQVHTAASVCRICCTRIL